MSTVALAMALASALVSKGHWHLGIYSNCLH